MSETTQDDRKFAAEVARFYLGNGATLPDDLRSGKAERHFTLDSFTRSREAGAQQERAAIVAFLRTAEFNTDTNYGRWLAQLIERGDHLPSMTKEG